MRTAAELRELLAAAEAQRDSINGNEWTDPAASRLGAHALKQHYKHMDSRLERYTALTERIQRLKFQLADAEAREAEEQRVPFTVEDVQGARLVRDRYSWWEVVRVSAKSVTVKGDWDMDKRIAITKILEVKR
jgi:hypothetical protein